MNEITYYTGCWVTGVSPSFHHNGNRVFPNVLRNERCVPLEVELNGVVYSTHPDEPLNGEGCYDLRPHWPDDAE